MMSVNSNKRKGRMNPSSNKLGRPKYYGEKMSCDGIYGNSRLMYAAASLVGCVVQVQVQNGTIFEGVLRTFSHQLDIVLETAHRVNTKCLPAKGISQTVSNLVSSYPYEGGMFEKLVFKLPDIILLQACNVDSDYAVKDNFTDIAISKFNGQIKERELEPWEGAGSDSENNVGLNIEDDDGINGWDANDMFRLNAEKYGVKSSYDNSLQEYTVPLTKKDTEEYKIQEAKAMKIAQEIETNSSYQSRMLLENGDEEDRFSAVVRPDDSNSSKYVLPQKRRNIPGPKRQQLTASSPIHMVNSKTYPTLPASSNIPNQTSMQYPTSLPLLEGPHSSPSFPNSSPSPSSSSSTPTTVSSVPKSRAGDDAVGIETTKISTESTNVDHVPNLSGPSKMQVLCPPQTLPPRIERQRINEKKFSKQKGRTDEIEEFKKFSSNFKLTEEKETNEPEEGFQASDKEPTVLLTTKLERTKIEKDEEKSANLVKFSTLNPNAKEFVFNPSVKSFTPRSLPVATSQPPAPVPVQPQPQRIQDQSPIMAVPPSQMIPSLPQPLFTMAPQYVMQAAPVSMAITSPFAAASPMSQTPRYRKVPITMQHRHDITPSMHVAAATGQPLLAPAAMSAPSQLTVQYTSPPGVIHASGPNQQTVGYPQMNFVVGPRVVSPQPVGVIPTSHSVSYCDTSHLPTHFIMSAHPGATHSTATTPHSLQQGQHSNHHPPQSQTPVLHPSPSPVHQLPPPHGNHHHHHHHHHHHPSQPPTPTAVMYPGSGAHLGQHPLQAAAHHSHSQTMSHPMHQHYPGFPAGPQPVVLMQQQQVPVSHHSHQAAVTHHHSLHMHSIHSQNHGSHVGSTTHILPQMTIIPTSAAITSAPTPPYVQHP